MDPNVPAVGGGIVAIGGDRSCKWGGINILLQLEAQQSPNFPVQLQLIPIEKHPYD